MQEWNPKLIQIPDLEGEGEEMQSGSSRAVCVTWALSQHPKGGVGPLGAAVPCLCSPVLVLHVRCF